MDSLSKPSFGWVGQGPAGATTTVPTSAPSGWLYHLAGTYVLIGLGFLSIPCLATRGDEADVAHTAVAEEEMAAIESLTSDLASSKFQRRRQAFLKLWRIGKPALSALQSAEQSANRSQAEAAATLQMLIELEVAPEGKELPADLIRLVTQPTMLSVIDLCEQGYWSIAEQIIVARDEVRESFEGNYGYYQLNRLVDYALEQGDAKLAWPIIRLVVPQNLAFWIAHKQDLPLSATGGLDADNTALQLFYSGNIEQALQQAANPDVLTTIAARSGRWEFLLTEPQLSNLTGSESAAAVATRAVLHELNGDLEVSNSMWANLLQLKPDLTTESTGETSETRASADDRTEAQKARQLAAEIRGDSRNPARVRQFMQALLISGHTAGLAALLEDQDPLMGRAFYQSQGDHARVLSSLGLQPDLANFDSWLEQRLQLLSPPTVRIDLFAETAQLCPRLVTIGFPDLARRLLRGLADIADADRDRHDYLWARQLVWRMQRGESRAMLLEEIIERYPSMSEECRMMVLAGLYEELETMASSLLATAPETADQDSRRGRWAQLEHLWRWDREWFGQQASRTVTDWLRAARQHAARKGELTAEGLSELSHLALGFGMTDLAIQMASAPEASDAINWYDLADLQLQLGNMDSAISFLEAIRKYESGYRHALLKEIEALLYAGRQAQALRLESTRWLRPLPAISRGSSRSSYYQIGKELHDAGDSQQAEEYLRAAFLLSQPDSAESFIIAFKYTEVLDALKQHEQASRVRRAILIDALKHNSSLLQAVLIRFQPRGFNFLLDLAQKERLHRSQVCIGQGDFDAVKHHIEVAERLQPQDIEVVIQCYPKLLAVDQPELAQSIFKRFEENMLKHLQQWPKDATALNNLAWMYAKCNSKLEEAETLSQTAVDLAPASATFLDTLAEIQYLRGNVQGAIETMRKCIRFDPRSPHYRQQIVRFEEGN